MTDEEVKELYETLRSTRADRGSIRSVACSGVYALFSRSSNCPLPGVTIPRDGLLYVGSSDSLSDRDHFQVKHSGFHTPRRSLGAILKSSLELTAMPRGPGKARSNFTNYRFSDDGEFRLSEWMREHLLYSEQKVLVNFEQIEKRVIAMFCPPLNLQGWKNPQRRKIMDLRKLCADEARAK